MIYNINESFFKKSNITIDDCQKVVNAIKKSKEPNSSGIIPKEEVEEDINKGKKNIAICKVINKPKTENELKDFSDRVNNALSKTTLSVSWRGKYLIVHKD